MAKKHLPHEHIGTKYGNVRDLSANARKNTNALLQIGLIITIAVVLGISALPSSSPEKLIANPEETNPEALALDELTAAEVAAAVAISSNTLDRDRVLSYAEVIGTLEALPGSDEEFIKKPATTTNTSTRSEIITHVVAKDETLEDIAKKYSIKEESIRWSNDLNNNNVQIGQELLIPPVDGTLHIVRSGDTASSLAERYSSSASRIISFNDAELGGLRIGSKIVIPGGRPIFSSGNTSTSDLSSSYSTTYGSGIANFGSLGESCAPKQAQPAGPISTGEVIGLMGSTGSSTGKHLHFGLCKDGQYIDPVINRKTRQLVSGFQWPVRNRKAQVSRWFDCTRYWAAARGNCPAGWYFHAGVDITEPYSSTTEILAIGDGEIVFRGYQYGSGYTVIINHGNGYYSQYRHMLPF